MNVPPDSPFTILIVEDDKDNADSLEMVFGTSNYHIMIADCGELAVSMAESRCPDVVLLDINLPGRNGWEIAKVLRRMVNAWGLSPFIIAITGADSEEDHRKSAEASIDLHFVKPSDPARLLRVLDNFRHIRSLSKNGAM